MANPHGHWFQVTLETRSQITLMVLSGFWVTSFLIILSLLTSSAAIPIFSIILFLIQALKLALLGSPMICCNFCALLAP